MRNRISDDPASKLNACVSNVLRIWEEGRGQRLTQMIFCDLSTPKGDGSFNVYDDIRGKLLSGGVPAAEVAFIHHADTETKKKELFAKVRCGKVQKMGEMGVCSMGAYLRKMALDGYCVRLDLEDVGELVRLLRICSNNLNQYAKKANETGSIYKADIEDLQERLDELWKMEKGILGRLAGIR